MSTITLRGPRIIILLFVVLLVTSLYLFYPQDHFRTPHSPADPYEEYEAGGLDSDHWDTPIEPDFQREEVGHRYPVPVPTLEDDIIDDDAYGDSHVVDEIKEPVKQKVKEKVKVKVKGAGSGKGKEKANPASGAQVDEDCEDGMCLPTIDQDVVQEEPLKKVDEDYKLRPKPGFSKPKTKPEPVNLPVPPGLDSAPLDGDDGETEPIDEGDEGLEQDVAQPHNGKAKGKALPLAEKTKLKALGDAHGESKAKGGHEVMDEETRGEDGQAGFSLEDTVKGGVIMPKLENATAKAELGRSAWHVMHLMTLRYPEKPTEDDRTALKSYFHLFSRLYPCGECADEFQKLLKQYPPQTSSRKTASMWLCSVHNMVNERLGKPEFDCLTLNEVYDCGCGPEGEEKEKNAEGDNQPDVKDRVKAKVKGGKGKVEDTAGVSPDPDQMIDEKVKAKAAEVLNGLGPGDAEREEARSAEEPFDTHDNDHPASDDQDASETALPDAPLEDVEDVEDLVEDDTEASEDTVSEEGASDEGYPILGGHIGSEEDDDTIFRRDAELYRDRLNTVRK